MENNQSKHAFPRCNSCGYVGDWKVESIMRPMDWVIGFFLLFLFGAGLVYWITVALIRSNKDRRDKICPICKAKNLWSFIY